MIRIETVKGDIYLEPYIERAWYAASKHKYFAQPHGEYGVTYEITPRCFAYLENLNGEK